MIIEKIKRKKDNHINEGFLIEAITNYIKKMKFPKNLLFKKINLMEDNLKKEYEDVSRLIIQGNESITDLMNKSEVLNNRCNSLLYKLRMEFSNNER